MTTRRTRPRASRIDDADRPIWHSRLISRSLRVVAGLAAFPAYLFPTHHESVMVGVVHLLTEEPKRVVPVQRDHVIQHLLAAASDPAFRRAVLSRSQHVGAFRLEPR